MAMGFGLRVSKVRLLAYANLLIGMGLICAILFLVRDLIPFSLRPERKAQEPAKKVLPVSPKKSFQDYGIILEKNPFGFPGGTLKLLSPSSSSVGTPAPATDVTLVGTVSGPKEWSYAIFADLRGEQGVFVIGDSVFGFGTLNRIEMDRVFLTKEGQRIEIALAEIASPPELKRPPRGGANYSRLVEQVGSGSYILDQRMVSSAVENPSQIMTEARLLPNIVDGKPQGFVLSEVIPGGIYQSLGLQDGDVLLRINENDISSPESALQAFSALRGMDRVRLDILRGGAKITMSYQIR